MEHITTFVPYCSYIRFLIHTDWRPRRSILFASWGAEEYALTGSYEWVEVMYSCYYCVINIIVSHRYSVCAYGITCTYVWGLWQDHLPIHYPCHSIGQYTYILLTTLTTFVSKTSIAIYKWIIKQVCYFQICFSPKKS
jgi:hypothetical protein